MVNNPTYSLFMEQLTRPSRPEILDKKFNIPFEESCTPLTNAMVDGIIDDFPSLESIGRLCETAQDIGESIRSRGKKGLED